MIKVTLIVGLSGEILDKKMLNPSGILVHVDDDDDSAYSSRI